MRFSLVPLAFSCAVLVLAFAGLFEWDVPLSRFIRSLNDFHMDHLANPWLAQLSDIGDRPASAFRPSSRSVNPMSPSPKKNNSPDSARSARRSSVWCGRSVVVIESFGSCGDRIS